MANKGMKRPAAVPTPLESKQRKKEVVFATEMNIVPPAQTVQMLLSMASYSRTDLQRPLEWGSGFDGTDMPCMTLDLLSIPHNKSWGAEIAVAPAYFALRNFHKKKGGHLFKDWESKIANNIS